MTTLLEELEIAAAMFDREAKRFRRRVARAGTGQAPADYFDAQCKAEERALMFRLRAAQIRGLTSGLKRAEENVHPITFLGMAKVFEVACGKIEELPLDEEAE